jgi:hypothetical protein
MREFLAILLVVMMVMAGCIENGTEKNPDLDGDGVPNLSDNCELVSNVNQTDFDNDSVGDVCDEDLDGDGWRCYTTMLHSTSDCDDSFPYDPTEWDDTDGDRIGNNVDIDDDNDGVLDELDINPIGDAIIMFYPERIDGHTNVDAPYNFILDYTFDKECDGEVDAYKSMSDEGKYFKQRIMIYLNSSFKHVFNIPDNTTESCFYFELLGYDEDDNSRFTWDIARGGGTSISVRHNFLEDEWIKSDTSIHGGSWVAGNNDPSANLYFSLCLVGTKVVNYEYRYPTANNFCSG